MRLLLSSRRNPVLRASDDKPLSYGSFALQVTEFGWPGGREQNSRSFEFWMRGTWLSICACASIDTMTCDDALDQPVSWRFDTTHWTAVLAAKDADESIALRAKEQLCKTYWYPVYTYFRWREGNPQEAEDLTQAFFAKHFLDPKFLKNVDRKTTKFRTFLLTTVSNYRISNWRRRTTKRRGGDFDFLPLDWEQFAEQEFAAASNKDLSGDERFDLEFALAMLDATLLHLRSEYQAKNSEDLLSSLLPYLVPQLPKNECERIAKLCQKTEGAVKVALHRLRERFQEVFREELANTVSTHVELEQELRYLLDLLRRYNN